MAACISTEKVQFPFHKCDVDFIRTFFLVWCDFIRTFFSFGAILFVRFF